MSNNRIIYQNWIVDLGRDPDLPVSLNRASVSKNRIDNAVRAALDRLTDEEREFIIRFYFMGQTYQDLSEETGRAEHKLSSLHKNTVRKVRWLLEGFVTDKYGLKLGLASTCPLCASKHAAEINELIANRDRTATWRGVIRHLKTRFGIVVRTPQLLIGHEKYHMATNQTIEEA